MSDSIPNAEEQIPSIDEVFYQLQGLPPEKQMPALAAVMKAVIGQMSDVDERLQQYCARLDDLDKEIHEDFFGPIHDQYQASVRGKGIDGLKQKYGSKFDELAEPLKAFGIDDIYGKLYDYLDEMSKTPDWKPENEGSMVDGIHSQAMERIGMVRGKPKEEAKAEEKGAEKPATEVAVSVEKKPEGSMKSKFAKGKGLLSGY